MKQVSIGIGAIRQWVGGLPSRVVAAVEARLNLGLPAERVIRVRLGWPGWLLPIIVINQVLTPHPIWTVLLVTIVGLYGVAWLWVRNQADRVAVSRRRADPDARNAGQGAIPALVVGDELQEEITVQNPSLLPLLWGEVMDGSTVPDYSAGRVVSTAANGEARWKTHVICRRRGVFRLGPMSLRLQDPFGLLEAEIRAPYEDLVVIYPRVVQLPLVATPQAEQSGSAPRRRPLPGVIPAATIADYRPGDSLRHVHWATSARHGRLMVKELEIEPSGDVWLVLDVNAAAQEGSGDTGTLEFGVVVAASLAAQFLQSREQRAVGLLAFGGQQGGQLIEITPARGRGHLWPILAALAQVESGDVALPELLVGVRDRLVRRSSVVVIAPAPILPDALLVQLAELTAGGVGAHVVTVHPASVESQGVDGLRGALAQLGIGTTALIAGMDLAPVLTYRRRRTVLHSTPTGGVIRREVEEEVG